MHYLLFATVLRAGFTFAAPLATVVQSTLQPSVQISSGTIVGSSDLTIDTFNGIPFAQPPVGDLRLRAPLPLNSTLGTFSATGVPRACPQQSPINLPSILPADVLAQLQGNPAFQNVTDSGEDCLTLNVLRPANVTSKASLPVLVWIYGGGFEFGSTQQYYGGNVVRSSIALGKPFLFVEMNYRVTGFGFLAGKELQAEGNTNLGLRDQRLALQWVQDNIAAFGGDPTQVTIWGESAGSISVLDQMIINGGDNSYKNGRLFRAGIMNSGSIIPTLPVDSSKAQNVYDTVVDQAGCKGSSDTLACLRRVDYGTFLAAVNSLPSILSYRSLDLAYLPRPDPSTNFFSSSPNTAVANGNYARVPVIVGDQQDEGTLFSLTQTNVTTEAALIDYLVTYFPSQPNARNLATGLVQTYPDDPAAGSPFNTGAANEVRPQFKRLAAILGDFAFTLSRRSFLKDVASQIPAWTYLSTYGYGTPILGTSHATDIPYDFDLAAGVPTTSIMRYYTSFIYNMDPNALGNDAVVINWPQWSYQGRDMLDFGLTNNSIIKDNFREASFQYLDANAYQLGV